MRSIFTSFLACSILLLANSYAGVIKGKVVNTETNTVLYNANVRIVETGDVTPTDNHGEFRFRRIQDGTYTIMATHINFGPGEPVVVQLKDSAIVTLMLTPSPWILNEVVVTGTRSPHLLKEVPVATEVISQQDMQRTGATTVDAALESSIGIHVSENTSGAGATIRGVDETGVLVLVDGERAVGRVMGTLDLGQFGLSNVEKIEIVKGTGSTLYGSDAMGGVINIITKRPIRNGKKGNALFEYGTHSKLTPSVDLAFGGPSIGVNFGGKFYSTAGFDLDKSTPHTNGQEAIDRLNLNGKVRAKLSKKWSTTLSGRFMHERKDWIESEIVELSKIKDTTYVYNDDETNNRYEGSLSLEYLSGDRYYMKFRFFASYYDHLFNKYTGPYHIDTSDTQDRFYEVSYTSNYSIGQNHVATYGFDINRQDLVSTELVADKEPDDAASAYFQYEYEPTRKLNVLSGVRYEWHSSFGGHFNPSINLMYNWSEGLKLRGMLSRGFRAPDIKQQYFIFDHTSAGYIVYGGRVDLPEQLSLEGFTDLVQENSTNVSVSAEISYGTIGLHRITYFYNKLDGLIDFVLTGFTPTYWRGVYVYQNIENAETQGVEWESRIRLTKNVDFSFSYTHLASKDLANGRPLRNRPAHSLKFFLTGFHEQTGLGGSIWGSYYNHKIWVARSNTGGNEGDDELWAPHQTRINLNLFKRFKFGLEVFARMENIFDETALDFGYWPGREIFVGAKYDLSIND